MKDYVGKKIAANYFRGLEAVGGSICFDEQGLTFQSHAVNLQRGATRIEYTDIVGLDRRNTLGFVPNGISIFTNDGVEHKFVINHRGAVLEFLKSKL